MISANLQHPFPEENGSNPETFIVETVTPIECWSKTDQQFVGFKKWPFIQKIHAYLPCTFKAFHNPTNQYTWKHLRTSKVSLSL